MREPVWLFWPPMSHCLNLIDSFFEDQVHDEEQKAWEKADVLPISPARLITALQSPWRLLKSTCAAELQHWDNRAQTERARAAFRTCEPPDAASISPAQPTDLKYNVKENTAWPLTVMLFVVKMLQGSTPLMWSVPAWLVSLTAQQTIFVAEMISSGTQKEKKMSWMWAEQTGPMDYICKSCLKLMWWIGKFYRWVAAGSGRGSKHRVQSNYPNLDYGAKHCRWMEKVQWRTQDKYDL